VWKSNGEAKKKVKEHVIRKDIQFLPAILLGGECPYTKNIISTKAQSNLSLLYFREHLSTEIEFISFF